MWPPEPFNEHIIPPGTFAIHADPDAVLLEQAGECQGRKLTDKQETKLADLLRYNLRSIRKYPLKEEFQFFWQYTSTNWAGEFLDKWRTKTLIP